MRFQNALVIAWMTALGACGEARDRTGVREPPRTASATMGAQGASSGHDGAAAGSVEQPAEVAPSNTNPYGVVTYGAVHDVMHSGDVGAKVELATLDPRNLIAVGALSGLRGEVTIVSGDVSISYDDGKGGVRIATELREQATLLVTAHVPRFRALTLDEDIPFKNLEAALEEKLRGAGYDTDVPIPLRIEGPVADVAWHVVNEASAGTGGHHAHGEEMTALRGVIARGEPSLVGFFSKHHQGVFTHHGAATHFHVVDSQRGVAGHVDSVRVLRGARLLAPE